MVTQVCPARPRLISLGAYPDVRLKRARQKRYEARQHIADGIEPSVERQERRAELVETFEGVAEEWLKLQSKSLAPESILIPSARLSSGLFPYIGSWPIASALALKLAPLLFVRPGELRAA